MSVWRLHTKTGSGYIGDYCLKNNIAAVGWCLWADRAALQSGKVVANDFTKYTQLVKNNVWDKKVLSAALSTVGKFDVNTPGNIQKNDLIWMRHAGVYYIGRVENNSEYFYNPSNEGYNYDACNQLTNIFWHEVGGEDEVAGAISAAFSRPGRTLQEIHSIVPEYSQLIYDKFSGKNIYNVGKLGVGKTSAERMKIFFSLMQWYELEDLVCFYLNAQYGYVVIPSTCKKNTPLYEFALLDPKTGKIIYIQVKMNGVIDADNYTHLGGDVYLCSVFGSVVNSKHANIRKITSDDLWRFLTTSGSYHLPQKFGDLLDMIDMVGIGD